MSVKCFQVIKIMMDYTDGGSLNVLKKNQCGTDYYSSLFWENFILNYEVNDKDLIVYHSKGKFTIPYTKEREKEILQKMKMQIMSWYETVGDSYFSKLYLLMCFISDFASFHFIKAFRYKKLIMDYKKNILFYKNENIINENLRKKAILLGFSENQYRVNINDAHFMSYDEINGLIHGYVSDEMVLKMRKSSL
jgi:hypothetical protein